MTRWIRYLGLAVIAACAAAPEPSPPPTASPSPSEILSPDPQIRLGRLSNGMRFYIRENQKPEKRAELRLAVDVGSILEAEDQLGLAHFTEHMAFNGTKLFPKQELIDYIESVGMRFGADLNAYTSFDETVYMLQVPTDSTTILKKGFQILAEWSHYVSFDAEEIDKERGVVIEEWRLGRGAGQRMFDKILPDLFKGSRYADRLPIGKKEVLEGFDHEALRKFYRDWYRPDLMAVIAVGDFNSDSIEAMIRESFASVPTPASPIERTIWPVPDHEETLINISTDLEATWSSVAVYYKQAVRPYKTVADYRQSLVESLYNGMLNQRLFELTKEEDPPFLSAGSSQGRFIRSKEFYILSANVREGGIERGLDAVLTEAERVQRHGFTPSELSRQKVNMLRGMEQAYRERDKSRSRGYAGEYIRNFLVGEPIPGIEKEHDLYNELIPGIGIDEVNRIGSTWIKDDSRVISVQMPEKEGLAVPRESDILAVMTAVHAKEIAPYVDDVSSLPLVEHVPAPGSVVSEKLIPEIEVTEWMLSNGVRVFLRPTDFKNDEVLFAAYSPGGHSLVEDVDYISAATATSVLLESGMGSFTQIQLRKKLAGKVVRVAPTIRTLGEGIGGMASPEDLETMFQLIFLAFTAPRADSSAFIAYKARMKGRLENRGARPETAFGDTISVTMSQNHHRSRPWTVDLLAEMDLQRSLAIYRDRFADASDFTFIFVGNFTPSELRPLIETYLGGLPSLNREETWRDRAPRPPKGIVKKTVRRGIEPKSQTRVVFTGPFEWNWQNRYDLGAMVSAFRIKLREVMREDLGATYGVGISASRSQHPVGSYSISVSFGCAPERADELREVLFAQIDSLREFGLPVSYVEKVQESQRRSYETDLKENRYWLNTLLFYLRNEEDPTNILKKEEKVKGLTVEAVQAAARKYFNRSNYAQFVMLPEEGAKDE